MIANFGCTWLMLSGSGGASDSKSVVFFPCRLCHRAVALPRHRKQRPPSAGGDIACLFLRPWGSAVVTVVLCTVPLAGLSVALCFGARQAALRLFLRPYGSALGSVGSCRFCSRVRLIFGAAVGALRFMSSAPSAAAVADTRFGGGHPPLLMQESEVAI